GGANRAADWLYRAIRRGPSHRLVHLRGDGRQDRGRHLGRAAHRPANCTLYCLGAVTAADAVTVARRHRPPDIGIGIMGGSHRRRSASFGTWTLEPTLIRRCPTPRMVDEMSAEDMPAELTDGFHLVVDALKLNGLDTIFGVAGIPITDLLRLAQAEGIRYYGFRHEQSAGNAAAIAGFLTQKPGICMTVSAPGFLNGLVALANATTNCFPMIMISGARDRAIVDLEQGDYEELDQLTAARPYAKAAHRDPRQGSRLCAGGRGDPVVHRDDGYSVPADVDGQGPLARRPSAIGRGRPRLCDRQRRCRDAGWGAAQLAVVARPAAAVVR